MATFLRGPRKGQTVVIHQIANDLVTVDKGTTIMKLGMLELTPMERIRFHHELYKGETFKVYREDHFERTGRFTKIQWARQ